MEFIDTTVLYIDENDLIEGCKHLNIEQIEWIHVKQTESVIRYGVVILKFRNQYKVLKSRY